MHAIHGIKVAFRLTSFVENLTIVKRTEKSNGIYMILQGTVGIFYKGCSVHELGPNEHFGHFCLFEHQSRYDYICNEPTICLFITKTDLESTLMRNNKAEHKRAVFLAKKDIMLLNQYKHTILMAGVSRQLTPEKPSKCVLKLPLGKHLLGLNDSQLMPSSIRRQQNSISKDELPPSNINLSPIIEPEPEHHMVTPTPTAKQILKRGLKTSPFSLDITPVMEDGRQVSQPRKDLGISPSEWYKEAHEQYPPTEPLMTLENNEGNYQSHEIDENAVNKQADESELSNDSRFKDSLDDSDIADIFKNQTVDSHSYSSCSESMKRTSYTTNLTTWIWVLSIWRSRSTTA